MKCPHCSVNIHDSAHLCSDFLIESTGKGFKVQNQTCPGCGMLILELVSGLVSESVTGLKSLSRHTLQRQFIYPMVSLRPVPPEVPLHLVTDYKEAATVLIHSPKASAALSRRILQSIIHEQAGIKKGTLFDEIQALIDEKKVPTYITDELDAIRHIGNWAAHPKRYQTTGEIVEVEPNEAEACLDAIDGLFDFYFVQPAKSAQRRQALQQKVDAQKKSS